MDTRKTFRNLPEMSIVGGPGMRELDLAITDPQPMGVRRVTQFSYVRPDKYIVYLNSKNIFVLERGKRDTRGDRFDCYLWNITGEASISLGSLDDESRVKFEITAYSTVTREGKVNFFEPDIEQ